MLKAAASLDSHIVSSLFISRSDILGGARRPSRSAMLRSGCIQLLVATLVLLVMTACGKSAKDPFSKFPTITSQPANQTVTVGQTATFSVTATSSVMPFSYQWFDNGTAIAGATSSTYTTPATVIGDNSSQFTVTVSNASGSATSNPATLTVTLGLPTITSQPANQSVTVGQTATFSVTATSSIMPFTYQWFDNGTAIAGATSSTYTTPATVIGDNSSQFTVTVSNTAGSTPSNPATLTVTLPLPVITSQPASVNVCKNASTTLSVTALNASTYQWSFNGSPIAGATSSTYFIASTNSTDSGSYTVTVANATGSVTSHAATVAVASSITSNPASLSIVQGQTASFSVAATGDAPLSYQWYGIAPGSSTGVALAGATSSTYTTPVVGLSSSGSQYYVTVTDVCSDVLTSTSATLTVTLGNVPPTITTQPVGQTAAIGGTATFTVVAVGPPTLTYQWYLIPAGSSTSGSAISGATAATYTVPATNTTVSNDQDGYYVIVSNPYGQATSQTAKLAIGNGILITKQPVSAYVSAGQPATFSVTATSTSPLTYQWFEAAPGTALFAAIPGATSATYTQATTATTDSGSVFYVVVSNGSSNPVTSNSVSLFVGPLTGISNFCSGWLPVPGGTTSPAPTPDCEVQLSTPLNDQSAAIVWPNLIPTGNLQLSFTFTTSDASTPPADGFAMTLGDPSLGATTSSIGTAGSGLGAEGIPGVVVVFDDYRDAIDPPVPYIAVGRGEGGLWAKPYFNINGNIPPLATPGATVSHDYVVSIVQGTMTVTMDGLQLFSGTVAVPPVAYLYFSASTGVHYEQTTVSNFSATVTAPSN